MGGIVPFGISAWALTGWSEGRAWPEGAPAPVQPPARPEAGALGLQEAAGEAVGLQPRAHLGGEERAKRRVSAPACWAWAPLPAAAGLAPES